MVAAHAHHAQVHANKMKITTHQLRRMIAELAVPNPVYIDDTDELNLQVAMKIKDMMPPEEALTMGKQPFKDLVVSVYETHFDPEGEGWEPYPKDLEAIEDHLTIVPEPGDPDYEYPVRESKNMKITKRQLRRIIREEKRRILKEQPVVGAQDLMPQIAALTDEFAALNDQLTAADGIGPTWPNEVVSASEDLRNRIIEAIQDVQEALDDGQYA